MNDLVDIHQLRRSVPIHRHPVYPSYVRLADIPMPWLQQFLEALLGSQMPVIEGEEEVVYAADWELFLSRAERRLRAGHIAEILREVKAGPIPGALEAAPLLDPWFPVHVPDGEVSLSGAASNHPLLPGKGRWIVTSMLIGIDLAAGWARTISRFYRLGRLIDVGEYEALRGKPLNPALTPATHEDLAPWFERLHALAARGDGDV